MKYTCDICLEPVKADLCVEVEKWSGDRQHPTKRYHLECLRLRVAQPAQRDETPAGNPDTLTP